MFSRLNYPNHLVLNYAISQYEGLRVVQKEATDINKLDIIFLWKNKEDNLLFKDCSTKHFLNESITFSPVF